MATIKDIAQLAGVSQGTVSNVLNGKGIVSSKRILLVQKAAEQLGYTANERAKVLRTGKGKVLAVLLPNIEDSQYVDFYLSFSNYAQQQGYEVNQYLTNDDPILEKLALSQIRSSMASGIVTYSSLNESELSFYKDLNVLFIERRPALSCTNYIGFDYALCGKNMAMDILSSVAKGSVVALVTDSLTLSSDLLFANAFKTTLQASHKVVHISTERYLRKIQAIHVFEGNTPSAIVCTNTSVARTCRDIRKGFFPDNNCPISTISPLYTLPELDFRKYELNYRLLGRLSAERILVDKPKGTPTILENTGFRNWKPQVSIQTGFSGCLNLLALDSPPAYAMQHFSRMYSKATGIEVKVSVASYEEIHELFNSMESASSYDVIRIGSDVLSWYAPRILRPLDTIDIDVDTLFSSFLDSLSIQYSMVAGTRYAIPVSPSLQMLYYRKDLFESTVLKRLYHERYHEQLQCPSTFEQFNRISKFFTKELNPDSPCTFGTTITLGNTAVVAGTEFMTRYFSHTPNLFHKGKALLNSHEALLAMEDIMALKGCVGTPNAWWTSSANQFAQGDAAMTILFSNFASDLLGPRSKISCDVGTSLVPGGNPLQGGGSLGISRHSRYPEEALRLIKWLCSEPVASSLALFGGTPVTKAAFDNYEIVDTYPWLEQLKTCFNLSHCNRTPSTDNAPFDDRRFVGMLGRAVKNSWFGRMTPSESLTQAMEEYNRTSDLLCDRNRKL